jgi:diaminohydroxyphosphoribosylaminopyrimidine deaminase / 5-amino-6-(5-phosphoribosylamino)uracil reductase
MNTVFPSPESAAMSRDRLRMFPDVLVRGSRSNDVRGIRLRTNASRQFSTATRDGGASHYNRSVTDEQLMRRALELAERGRYSVSPNPMVGCVIARDGAIIAEGFHHRAGEAHAEIEALHGCNDPRGATMVVSLEPCCHSGRTGPCTEAIIEAGIGRVVIAMRDPHDLVDGRGVDALRSAGIEITEGVLESEGRRANEKFAWAATNGLPFVLLKAAMTLDGKLATVTRESQWITSEAARARSLALREEYDAIMVGSGTVIADNPRLTRRLGWNTAITPWTRVVVDAGSDTPQHAQLFRDGGRTVLFAPRPPDDFPPNVEVVPMRSFDGRLDLQSVLRDLYDRGVQSVLVEGGSLLDSDFIRRGLWQKMIVFVAPLVVGGGDAPAIFSGDPVSRLTDAYRFRFDRVESVGSDLMITAYNT